MTAVRSFEECLNEQELALVGSLRSPASIQAFLDAVPYSTDPIYRSPLRVLRDNRAHCVDGAFFAAAMLRRLGHPPVVVELFAERDDDHFVATYRLGRFWGAVAKSNFAGLRFREAVYCSLRELVMSYFEFYYNIDREKTLRSYTIPVNMKAFDHLNWMTSDEGLEAIVEQIDRRRSIPVLSADAVSLLSPVDARSYEAGMVGVDLAGVYRPSKDSAVAPTSASNAVPRGTESQDGSRIRAATPDLAV